MIYFFCKQNRQCVLPQEIIEIRFAEAKMEAGESPARSRHCKDEPAFKNVTGEIWEGESEVMSPSQENCLFDNHRYVPTSDRKGIGVCWF